MQFASVFQDDKIAQPSKANAICSLLKFTRQLVLNIPNYLRLFIDHMLLTMHNSEIPKK